jgi:hypothetical protein
LEVILATSILLACLIVLGELAALGRGHADDAEELTTAQLICRTKLNEILAGVAPAHSADSQQVEEAPGWVYSVNVQPLGRYGLVSLRITVTRDMDSPEGNTAEPTGKAFTLTRWMRQSDDENLADLYTELFEETPFEPSEGGELLR